MVASYDVILSPKAAQQVRKLPAPVLPKVLSVLDSLTVTPRPNGAEKLTQCPNYWRVRAGKFHRIVYIIDDRRRRVAIALVSHRREVYREIADVDRRKLTEIILSEDNVIALASGVRH